MNLSFRQVARPVRLFAGRGFGFRIQPGNEFFEFFLNPLRFRVCGARPRENPVWFTSVSNKILRAIQNSEAAPLETLSCNQRGGHLRSTRRGNSPRLLFCRGCTAEIIKKPSADKV